MNGLPRHAARSAVYIVAMLAGAVTASGAAAQASDIEQRVAAASADAGQKLSLRCKACHTLTKGGPNRLGPNLWGVVGRNKASADRFKYSPAMKKLTGTWDLAALDAFLAKPRSFAPGNRMTFPGLARPSQRADMIAYLRTLSDTPPAQLAARPPAAKTPAPAEPAAEDDPALAAMPPGAGREETAAICAACHSIKLVAQQGLSRDRWADLLVWMTEKQGMPKLDRATEDTILDYLAQAYGAAAGGAASPMSPMAPMMPMMPGMMAPAMPPPPPQR